MRRHFPRFQKDNFDNNLKLVEQVDKIAKVKGCTTGNVAIAWVKAHSGRPAEIIPIPGTTTTARLEENVIDVKLSADDVKALDDAVKNCEVVGARYPAATDAFSWG
jgi:pyridoxine 4-dehydrogenase